MKAFVIKNKEGKYWQLFYNDESEFVDEIYNAFMHYSKENAEKDIIDFDLKDCKVVEITIAEGDLEEENRVLKKALELVCETIDSCMDCYNFNCREEPYNETHNCIECIKHGLREKHLSKYFIEQAKESNYERNRRYSIKER